MLYGVSLANSKYFGTLHQKLRCRSFFKALCCSGEAWSPRAACLNISPIAAMASCSTMSPRKEKARSKVTMRGKGCKLRRRRAVRRTAIALGLLLLPLLLLLFTIIIEDGWNSAEGTSQTTSTRYR